MIIDTGIRTDWAGKNCSLTWAAISHFKWPTNVMFDWCLDNFGIDHFDNWFYSNGKVYFANPEHAALFVLRWS